MGEKEKAASGVPTAEELALIGRYTRRELAPEEVYTFPVLLCDNEIDREGERFSIPALEKLADLFVGKTGIFDHEAKGNSKYHTDNRDLCPNTLDQKYHAAIQPIHNLVHTSIWQNH